MNKSNIFPWKVLEMGNKSDSESQPSISLSKDDDNPTPKKLHTTDRKREEPCEYLCSMCSFHCQQWFRFEDHVKIVPSIAALFPCQISNCFKYYQSKNGLKNHCKTCHLDSLLGAFVANGPMALQVHIQEHSDQSHQKFKCASCDRGFGSKWDQNRHFKKCPKNPDREITCKRLRWVQMLTYKVVSRALSLISKKISLLRDNGFVKTVINCMLQKNL